MMLKPYHTKTEILVNDKSEPIILNLRAGSFEKYNSRLHRILENHFPD